MGDRNMVDQRHGNAELGVACVPRRVDDVVRIAGRSFGQHDQSKSQIGEWFSAGRDSREPQMVILLIDMLNAEANTDT